MEHANLRAMRAGVATLFFMSNAYCGSDPCMKELTFCTIKGWKSVPVFVERLHGTEEEFKSCSRAGQTFLDQ